MYNPNFKVAEFDHFKMEAGLPTFVLSPKQLTEITNEKLEQQLKDFCRYCGNFKAYEDNFGNFIPRVEKEPFKNKISESWKSLYEEYNAQ